MGTIWVSSFFARTGIEEGDLGAAKVKKCPVDTFLARGRFHWAVTAAGTAVGTDQSMSHQKYNHPHKKNSCPRLTPISCRKIAKYRKITEISRYSQ